MLSNGDGSNRFVLRKGLTMGGFLNFLVGGALGAALGILFVKRQKPVKPARTTEALPAQPEAAPAPPPEAAPVATEPVAQPVVIPPVAIQETPAAVAPPAWTEPITPVAPPEPMVDSAPAAPIEVAPAPAPPVAAEAPPAPPVVPVWVEPAEPTVEATAPVSVAAPPPPVSEPVAPAPEVTPRFAPVAPAAVAAAPVASGVAGPPVVPIPRPETSVDESHPVAWAVTGAAAAGLAHAAAEKAAEEEPGVLPEDTTSPDIAAVAEESDTVVVLAPQVLEEPLPGSGWEPSAVMVEEEMELEELLPVVADDVRPYEGPEVAAPEPAVVDEWDRWPETAAAVAAATAAATEPEVVAEPEAPAELEAVEPPVVAEPEAPPELEAVVPLVIAEPEAASEEAVLEEPAVEAEPEVTPMPMAVDEATGEDLRARIEETRRRIREELERPFAIIDHEEQPEEVAAPAGTTAAASLAAAISSSPLVKEPVYAGAEQIHSIPEPVAVGAAGGNGSEYDAMRARIEMTRSRLKAKAFDAMMAGESSLLRRDPEGASAPQKSVSVDREIDQTVESTLREEDD